LLGYLIALGGEVHGIDISPEMVRHCEIAYPEADVRVGDLGDLAPVTEGVYDAIFAAFNVIDVFDDAERRAVLGALRDRLAPDGVLIFASHNLSHVDRAGAAGVARPPLLLRLLGRVLSTPPAKLWSNLCRLPRRWRNHRRLAPLEHRGADHAILNDSADDFALLHYYISRDDQERQLRDLNLELLECLDLAGRVVPPGQAGDGPWLHYVAHRAGL
jgi:SAM-dependent methyltransferase